MSIENIIEEMKTNDITDFDIKEITVLKKTKQNS